LQENPSEHIAPAELARLLEESRQTLKTQVSTTDMHPHFANCPSCREQFEELASLDRGLSNAAKAEPATSRADCPAPAVWREVAGGGTPPEETFAFTGHASRCDQCSRLLREAISEFAGLRADLTDDERKQIAALPSAGVEWQQRLARQIAGAPRPGPDRARESWWRRWFAVPGLAGLTVGSRAGSLAMAGAALLVAVGAGYWVEANRNQPAATGQLLARAYTEKRTLELRFAGAAYAPLRISRGPEASFTSRPAPLLKAEALIARQLESHPSDPAWLQAQAQADVLEGKYDAAVEALRRALELEPHSPAILTDLATAYFQRAQQEDRKDDLGAAYEYLSQSLRLRPDDPVALFNRAIVAEHQFLYHQALDDWEHYLRVDPGSEWAGEAREAADRLRAKLKEHEASQAAPLLSPQQIAAAAGDPNLRSAVDGRVEEYLQDAVRVWLPRAYPETATQPDLAARQALFFLADLATQQHNDRWLSDLLGGSSSPDFPQAITALAGAVMANKAAEFDTSRKQADRAERLFRSSGNVAGTLRAQFEQIYAAQIERRSELCRQRATAALSESERYSYPWLHIQFGLEVSVCSVLMGDIGSAESAARRAMEQAQKSNHGALYLRALAFVAEDRFLTGDRPGGWKLVSAGLERYWSEQVPAMRGYNLYYTLGEAGDQPDPLEAIWREAAALIDSDGDLLVRAAAHNYLADAATAARQPQFAEQQYALAAQLYALAPRTEASRSDMLEDEIRTAQVESRIGRFDAALARLTSVQDRVRVLTNNYLVEIFYSTLGELQLSRDRPAEAEQALRPALALAELSLASLSSDAARTSWSKDAAPAYLALIEAELAQGRSQEGLETYEWYLGTPQRVANRRRHQSVIDPPLPGPLRLESSLPSLSSETVLAFAALPSGLAVWVYDDRGINGRWISKRTDSLQELAERFHDLSSDPGSELSALRRDARSLHEELVAPVQQYLMPGRTLIIEADGWLARVPFEALLDSSDHYLIEHAPIVHSLGQDSQARLRSDTGISADLPTLVVASTASPPADGLIPLPDVAAEAYAVAAGFHSARVLKGEEATLSAVRSELPAAAVFHFAGHSLATSGRTGLMLTGEDRHGHTSRLMDANAVRQLHLTSLQLAVLSACSTASGSGGSSGFESLADAFLGAGVPHVVASRWAVDSVETRGFVEDFYRNALSGQPVSEALRQSARKMMANPRTAHPYYWSAFSAFGRP
jgi:CHAT domain-containing protein/tetratricopeptide (TPR) repeat protein